MDKKIDIENLLYYKYLIDLKFDNIKQDNKLVDIDKRINNFDYLITKSIDNETKEFIDIYNALHKFNEDITEYLNKIMTQGSEEDKKYITYYEKIKKNINKIIQLLSALQKTSPQKKQSSPRSPPQQQQQAHQPRSPPQQQQQPQQQPPHQQKNLSKSTRKLVLINAVGDGDCFINAIFDYGLYTNKINKIYKKINYLKNFIFKYYANHQNYKFVTNIHKNFNIKHDNILNIINKSLYLINPIPDKYTNRINIKKYYSHQDENDSRKLYDHHRINFILTMKYIWALYSLTINFKDFRDSLQNRYFLKKFNSDTEKDLPEEIVNFIKTKYYMNNRLIHNINFDYLTIDYILQFYKETNIYSSHIEISRFARMFMEPITDSIYKDSEHITDTSFDGDKFFIDYKLLINIKKGDDYKKEHKDGIKEHNISVINENGNHFLLCLYEDEMSYDFNDKGEIINGGFV